MINSYSGWISGLAGLMDGGEGSDAAVGQKDMGIPLGAVMG